jgi:DNA-binding response OmpR family regulator
MKVLIVEDEARIASFLTKGLSNQGYDVECVATGGEALARVRSSELDLLILDLGLADMDGLDVLRQLRADGNALPVIIVTARGEVEDRVEGLDVGANDYLTKPFAFDELLARIRARLRCHNGDPDCLDAGGVRLHVRMRRAEVAGEPVDLSDREYALLETLVQRPGEIVSREQLLAEVWGRSFDPGGDIVDTYVARVRRKVGDVGIETVPGEGYRFTLNGHGRRDQCAPGRSRRNRGVA